MSPLGTLESPPRTEQDLDLSKADADILSHPDIAEIRQAHDAIQTDFYAENGSNSQDSAEGQSDEGAELGASSETQKNTKEDIIAEIAQVGDSLLRGLGTVSTTTPATPSQPAPQPTAPHISVPHTPRSPQAQPPQSRPTGHDDVLDLRLGIVDQTRNGRALADVAADARLGAETNESRERGRLKAIGHSLWKMGTLKGIFRRHYSNKAFAESVKSQDIYKHIDADEQDRKQAKINAVTRALAGHYSESIGEQRRELSKDSQLYKDLTSYLVEVTDTQRQCPTEEEVEGEYQRILAEHPDELYGGGMITSHNFYELVLKARGANINRESVVHAIENMPIIMAESRLESNKNLRRDRTEKILDWVDSQGKKNKLLSAAISIAPETAVTVGITAAATVLGLGRDSLIRNAGRVVFFGVGGATVGAMRARRAARQQIRQHRVERTLGLQYNLSDKNRERLEELRYETKPYDEIAKAIYDTVDQEKIDQGGDEALKAALLAAAEAQVRRGFFDRGYDVIDFEGLGKEGGISEFENARKHAFNVLSPLVRSLDVDTCTRLGIPHGAELKKIMSKEYIGREIGRAIQSNIDDVKKLENGYVNSKALGGAAMGGFFAAAGTLVVGEAVDIVKSHFSSISAGSVSGSPMVDQYNGVKMNGGYHMVPDRDGLQMGNYDIQDANGNVVVDNLKYDPSTGFDGDSLTKLHDGGFDMAVGHHAAETTTQQVSIGDYINKHPTEFQKLNVQWMDNDTAQFDLNEQGMRLTSNPDGSITLGQVMTEHGSSHGGSEINMTDPSHVAVDMAFMQPDGTFAHHVLDIKQGDQIPDQWKPFFQEKADGTWVFNGGEGSYASLGKLDGDKFYSAAAIPNGDGEVPTVTDTVETSPAHVTTELKGPDHDSGLAVGAVGVPGRRGLTVAERPIVPPYGSPYGSENGYGNEGISEREVSDMVRERSPRLISNPDAILRPEEELDWYKSELTKRHGSEQVKKFEDAIDNSKELSEMPIDLEVLVTIPVAAAQEADTIYETLSLYAKQSSESLKKSLVLLNLNWLDEAMTDADKRDAIEKCRQEIQRARNDFPDLKIATVENEYNAQKARETGGVIGYAVSDLVDTALLALQRRMKSGMDQNHEVLILRNDADPEGVSRNYLENYQKALNDPKNKSIDVFKGVTRFGSKWAEKYPGFALASNFAASLSIMLSSRGMPATGGANFAIKASTYAAIGGLGGLTRTGAGSDDGAIGRRIRLARWGIGVFPHGSLSQSTMLPNGEKVDYRAVAAHVTGAVVDTNPSRLVPYYIQGRSYTEAWGSDFTSGNGVYRDRADGMTVTPDGESEIKKDYGTQFKAIENTITSELRWNSNDDARRVLSVFFSQVPGAYTLSGELGSNNVRFQLTKAGKKYLKERFEKQSYGKRLYKGQYDGLSGRIAPLISPSKMH